MKCSGNKFFAQIKDLVFPKYCVGCGKEEYFICPECRDKTIIKQYFECPICRRLQGDILVCPKCLNKSHLDGLWVLTDYENQIITRAIHQLKFNFIREIVEELQFLIINYYLFLKKQNNLPENYSNFKILPIPLHRKRLLWRGFNQSADLSNLISEIFNLKISDNILIRGKFNQPQSLIDNADLRFKNIENVFEYYENFRDKSDIMLVDDVCTSGATLNEAAKILKLNGHQKVFGLVLARG